MEKTNFFTNTFTDISDEIIDIDWPKDLKIAQKLSKLLHYRNRYQKS